MQMHKAVNQTVHLGATSRTQFWGCLAGSVPLLTVYYDPTAFPRVMLRDLLAGEDFACHRVEVDRLKAKQETKTGTENHTRKRTKEGATNEFEHLYFSMTPPPVP